MSKTTLILVEEYSTPTARAAVSPDAALRWYRDEYVSDSEWAHFVQTMKDDGETVPADRKDLTPREFLTEYVGEGITHSMGGKVQTVFGEDTDYIVTVWEEEAAI